jgi:flagellar secretion chaperone FliS
MYQSMYQESLDAEVLTAEPMELVQMLYRGALGSVGAARRALNAGDIATRSRKISNAIAILNELALSLDHSKDPAFSSNLVELYDYMLRRLIEANVNQIEPPLVEVEGLLGGILAAWQQAAQAEEQSQPNTGILAYADETGTEYRQLSYAY